MRVVLAYAVLLVAVGCSSPPSATETPKALPVADQETLIRRNTSLTPSQKEMEIARLRAAKG